MCSSNSTENPVYLWRMLRKIGISVNSQIRPLAAVIFEWKVYLERGWCFRPYCLPRSIMSNKMLSFNVLTCIFGVKRGETMGFLFPPTPSRICIRYNASNQGWNPSYLFCSPICFFESLSWRKRNFAIESGSAVTKPLSWRYFSPRLGSKLNCFTP